MFAVFGHDGNDNRFTTECVWNCKSSSKKSATLIFWAVPQSLQRNGMSVRRELLEGSLQYIKSCKYGKGSNNSQSRHLIDVGNMFAISLLPIELITLDARYGSTIDCIHGGWGFHDISFASMHQIKVRFGKRYLKIMVHSSFDEILRPMSDAVAKNLWGLCWHYLNKYSVNNSSPGEPMIFITHIGSRQVEARFLAKKIQAVIARQAGVKEFDLSANTHAQLYSANHFNKPTAPRLSWVMTRVPALGKDTGIKQNQQTFYKFRPDSTPSGLHFPYYDYTAMFPSYTTFIIHRKSLNKVTE